MLFGRHVFRSGGRQIGSVFERSLKYMAGEFVEAPPSDFPAYIREKFPDAKNICSVVSEYPGNKKPADYSNLDFQRTRDE
jgi:hypothetical protein